MRFFKRSKSKRLPAKGYSQSSARKAIFHLAIYSEDQSIREEAVKHIMANLSDSTKKIIKKRSGTYTQAVRFALETERSMFDSKACGNDQEFLIWVSNRRYCWQGNMVAIRHLYDQEILKDIAINEDAPNPEKRMTALSRLIDQDLILEVILKAGDNCRDALQEALRRLPNDQKLLLKIIKKAVSPFIRLMALKKIDDLKIIRKIAVRNNCFKVRLEAMKRVGDTVLYRRIAMQDKNRDNRIYALNNIDDQKVISKVSRYDKDKQVRFIAINKLQNKRVLKRIAKNEREDLEIRSRAASKLSDSIISNKINSLINTIAHEKNAIRQNLLNDLIDRARSYFANMSIVKVKKSLYEGSNGNLSDLLQELEKRGIFYLHNDDPRESYGIIFHNCNYDSAKLTLNVENYMAENGWVYDDYTFLIIMRTGDDEFYWYQKKETRESN